MKETGLKGEGKGGEREGMRIWKEGERSLNEKWAMGKKKKDYRNSQ